MTRIGKDPVPKAEPVGEVTEVSDNGFQCEFNQRLAVGAKLYTIPPAAQRPWVGLTDEEIEAIGDKVANEQLVGPVANFRVRLARAIEQTLKEKNHD